MTSIDKQLVLHGLKIPVELIRIIKDYTFMDTVMAKSKRQKNKIIRLIEITEWSGKARPFENREAYVFWIEEDESSPQFQMYFCNACGNYQDNNTNYPDEGRVDRVLCNCYD
jgi:hypothetical protein